MFRYLKEAFWARPQLAGLGAIPWNALAVAGTALVGFAEPAVWLAGAGLETLYLYVVATNPRFQKWVDATQRPQQVVAEKHVVLDAPSRARLEAVKAKHQRVEQLYVESPEEDFLFDSNREALRQLIGMFEKLLVARRNLVEHGASANESELRKRIADAERELTQGAAAASETLRESREATLAILRQRLRNLQRREQTLAEIESDLTRVEAQFDLAVEDATLKGRPVAISANIGLVSHLLDDAFLDGGTTYASREIEN